MNAIIVTRLAEPGKPERVVTGEVHNVGPEFNDANAKALLADLSRRIDPAYEPQLVLFNPDTLVSWRLV